MPIWVGVRKLIVKFFEPRGRDVENVKIDVFYKNTKKHENDPFSSVKIPHFDTYLNITFRPVRASVRAGNGHIWPFF